MDAFDGIIMWTWEESNIPVIPEKFEIFKKLTPKNRRMFGCYLYDFHMSKPSTPELVKWQLDFYYEQIKKGDAEGQFHLDKEGRSFDKPNMKDSSVVKSNRGVFLLK